MGTKNDAIQITPRVGGLGRGLEQAMADASKQYEAMGTSVIQEPGKLVDVTDDAPRTDIRDLDPAEDYARTTDELLTQASDEVVRLRSMLKKLHVAATMARPFLPLQSSLPNVKTAVGDAVIALDDALDDALAEAWWIINAG